MANCTISTQQLNLLLLHSTTKHIPKYQSFSLYIYPSIYMLLSSLVTFLFPLLNHLSFFFYIYICTMCIYSSLYVSFMLFVSFFLVSFVFVFFLLYLQTLFFCMHCGSLGFVFFFFLHLFLNNLYMGSER